MNSSPAIHPSAIVHPKAELGKNVSVGAYSIIGPNVIIGDNTIIDAHVIIHGYTTIGKGCYIYPGAVLGTHPQDLKYKGGQSYLIIGDSNKIREFVTIQPGTEEGSKTIVGNNNLIMAYSHIAHNCNIGNNVVLANTTNLAGFVEIEDYAFLGGGVYVHQFVRIGSYCMVGGLSKVIQDIPPYVLADGRPAKPYGLNLVGLKRHNFDSILIDKLKRIYHIFYRSNLSKNEALEKIEQEFADCKEALHFVNFIKKSKRGVIR